MTIPFYNVYASDTWHALQSVTVNYGLGWTLEMPPTEATGKQVVLVDANDNPVQAQSYLASRQSAALAGQVYEPQIGYSLLPNVAGAPKYPYNPYYKSFSPRLSVAINPHPAAGSALAHLFGDGATVIRGGYGRVYGRLNGVGLVLTPLLGTGLIQGVQCRQALATGACGPATPTDSTAFRIGVDGNTAPLAAATPTLPQPIFPGYNSAPAAAGSTLDPNFRPNDVDSITFSIQRQLNRRSLIEVGYIGRIIHHEFQPININTVPYMMTLGGQSFAGAYAAIETAMGCATTASQCAATLATATSKSNPVFPIVSPQPFLEAALKQTYCAGYVNCTTALLHKQISNLAGQQVFNIWSALDNGNFNFPRSLTGTPIPGSPNGASGQIGSVCFAGHRNGLRQLQRRLRFVPRDRLPWAHGDGKPYLLQGARYRR